MKNLQKIAHPELVSSILENISALVLVADNTGSITYCSPSILRLLKVDKNEVLGAGWWQLTRIDIETRNKEINAIKRIVNGQQPLNNTPYVKKISDHEGSEYWIQWQDSIGPGNTLIGVGQNITEQYNAEKLIEDQHLQLKRLSLVAEKTNNIILILDKKGNVDWVSESFERLNKITLAELITKKGPNILTISNNPKIAQILHRVITEKISLKYESKNNKINEVVWELSTISPVLDENGELINMIIIDSDITAMKKLEFEHEKLSLIASKTDNAVLIAKADCTIEWINEGLLKMYPKNTTSSMTFYGKNFLDLSSNPDIRNLVEQCREKKISISYEAESTNNEGKKIWVQSTLTPIVDDDNRITNFIIIGADITAGKQVEETIRKKNKDITDSINYAQRIQQAILPPEEIFKKNLSDHFIVYKPKDIVSGDFYWITEKENNILFASVDCTGHGVPGAFMSIIGFNLLNQIVKEQNIISPSEILKQLSKGVQQSLKQNQLSEIKDGMDISLCSFDRNKMLLKFSGAFNPLYHFSKNQLHEIKADKYSIGDYHEDIKYSENIIELNKGDSIYLFSDGYADQFGGKKGKKFKYRQFKELLISIQGKSMQEQKSILETTIENWKGNLDQTDDILIIGVKI